MGVDVKKHYVYVHMRLTDGSVFYVGQGKGPRVLSKSGRNPHWHRTVSKYGYSQRKIAEGLSQGCALSIERAVIAHYGRENLVNLTDGGDIGPSGMKHSEEVKRAQSERSKGNTYTLGRKLSEEHKAKIRAYKPTPEQIEARTSKIRGKSQSPEHRVKISAALKGRVFTDEWRANISKSQRNRPLMSTETRAKISVAGKGKRTGKDNPAYGIPKTEAQKQRLREAMTGRTFSDETLAKRSGVNHPRHDPTPVTLVHVVLGERTATRKEFQDEYGISSTHFSALVRGTRKSSRGWRLPS
jgi:hypothetical protein